MAPRGTAATAAKLAAAPQAADEAKEAAFAALAGPFSEPWRRRLLLYLRRHGAYPDRHRAALWRRLLELPRDEAAHARIVRDCEDGRCEEAAAACLERCQAGGRPPPAQLRQLLAQLTAWAPALADVAPLSAIAARLLEVFSSDGVVAFEACAFFLLHWYGPTLDAFPGTPAEALASARDLIAAVDPELVSHIERLCSAGAAAGDGLGAAAGAACGPAFPSTASSASPGGGGGFAEVPPEGFFSRYLLAPLVADFALHCLPRSVWLALWDHIVTRWREGPGLASIAACAVLRCLRESLLALSLNDLAGVQGGLVPFEGELRKQRSIPAARLLEEFYMLRERYQRRCVSPPPPSCLPMRANSGAYPPLLRGRHFVLDYLTLDRSMARKEAKDAERASLEAAARGAAMEALLVEELRGRSEQVRKLRAEQARRELARQDDARLERERHRRAQSMAVERVARVEAACDAVRSAVALEGQWHELESLRIADERARRRRVASLDVETRARELEMADLEAACSIGLGKVVRQRRAEALGQELRQDVRSTILERQREDDLAQRQLRDDAAREAAATRLAAERAIEAHQLQLAALQRSELEQALELDEQERQLQLGRVAQARASRLAAQETRETVDVRLEQRRRWLESVREGQAQAREAKRLAARQRSASGGRLQERRRVLAEAQRDAQQRLEQQTRSLQEEEFNAERLRFDERVRQSLEADEAAAADFDARLRPLLEQVQAVAAAC